MQASHAGKEQVITCGDKASCKNLLQQGGAVLAWNASQVESLPNLTGIASSSGHVAILVKPVCCVAHCSLEQMRVCSGFNIVIKADSHASTKRTIVPKLSS